MSSNTLPPEMRFKLREYLYVSFCSLFTSLPPFISPSLHVHRYESVHLTRSDNNNTLLGRLTNTMQYEVSWFINKAQGCII